MYKNSLHPFSKWINTALFTLFLSGQVFSQCPPNVNVANDTTILCGSTINIGGVPAPPPSTTPAPACSNPGQLTQMGGSYTNSISTTGGITNISNMNTLVNGIDPLNAGAPIASW